MANIIDYLAHTLTGNFNININQLHDIVAATFRDLLERVNRILFPMLRSQNILDLIITSEDSKFTGNHRQGELFSDDNMMRLSIVPKQRGHHIIRQPRKIV